jgi:hypothetical protein
MPSKYDTLLEKEQELEQVSQQLTVQFETFLLPLVMLLDSVLDKRLVRTFVQCCKTHGMHNELSGISQSILRVASLLSAAH